MILECNNLKKRICVYMLDFYFSIFLIDLALYKQIYLILLFAYILIVYYSEYTLFGYIFKIKIIYKNNKNILLYIKKIIYSIIYNIFLYNIPIGSFYFYFYNCDGYDYENSMGIKVFIKNCNDNNKCKIYKIDYFKTFILCSFMLAMLIIFIKLLFKWLLK